MLENVRYRFPQLFLACAGLFISGCTGFGAKPAPVTEIQQLRDQIEAQQRQLAGKDEQLAEQTRRIQDLQSLSGDRALEKLVHVARIEIERLSGGYDDNRDGIDEGVVVYLRQYDQDGDLIKATGSIQVSLLDLAKPPEAQKMGQTRLTADQARPLWYGRMMTYHYTIKVPWAGGATRPDHKSITVLVRFIDLLSGQSFESQVVVEVAGVKA